jgi:serine/threonine protein kinase
MCMVAYHHLFRLNDVIQSEGRLYLVFEFVDKDLKKYFEACGDKPLAPELIKSYALQLLRGIEYCHVRGVMHR